MSGDPNQYTAPQHGGDKSNMSGDPNQYNATQQGGQPPQQHQTEDRNMYYGGQGGGYQQGGYHQGGYQQGGYQQGGYSAGPYEYTNPFAALVPSTFPPGTDPNIVNCFQMADQDRSGFIDDWELQRALSSCNQSFSLRTVHLLMFLFTNTNNRKIGPRQFITVYQSLMNWRAIFEKYDRDGSGRIDANELREALYSLGFQVSGIVLDLLVFKFNTTGGGRSIQYDNFIECCLTVKGLTERFKEKDTMYNGTAAFTYDAFLLTVLPFLIA